MKTKELNIKIRTCYFYNDLINISNFEANNLNLDKKTFLELGIHFKQCKSFVFDD